MSGDTQFWVTMVLERPFGSALIVLTIFIGCLFGWMSAEGTSNEEALFIETGIFIPSKKAESDEELIEATKEVEEFLNPTSPDRQWNYTKLKDR